MIGIILLQLNKKSQSKSCVYRALVYSSFTGINGVGNTLKKEFENLSDCDLEIVNGGSSSELESKVLIQPRRYDVVIGLQYNTSLSASIKWTSDKIQFSYSPMIIMLKGTDIKKIVVPDLKKSEVGKNFYQQKITHSFKTYKASSWTNALSLFNQNKNMAFYTFAGSLFYFRNALGNEKMNFLKGAGGVYKEYFRFLKSSSKQNSIFEKAILSKKIQENLWSRNYMYPVVKKFYPVSLKQFILETGLE